MDTVTRESAARTILASVLRMMGDMPAKSERCSRKELSRTPMLQESSRFSRELSRSFCAEISRTSEKLTGRPLTGRSSGKDCIQEICSAFWCGQFMILSLSCPQSSAARVLAWSAAAASDMVCARGASIRSVMATWSPYNKAIISEER